MGSILLRRIVLTTWLAGDSDNIPLPSYQADKGSTWPMKELEKVPTMAKISAGSDGCKYAHVVLYSVQGIQ